MELRQDLLAPLKDEDILAEVLANHPRYKPEPLFSKDRSWQFVVSLNRAARERGSAQHGLNPETQAAGRAERDAAQRAELALAKVFETLCESASFQPGARIKTLRGSTHGVIVRGRADGKLIWRTGPERGGIDRASRECDSGKPLSRARSKVRTITPPQDA